MSKVIISDTSCLIALDLINKLDILHQLFPEILNTPEVQKEFKKRLPAWIHIQEVKNTAKKQEISNLVDAGEASAIALAIETSHAILIIDEKKGRQIAKNYYVTIIGTLRVILLAKQKNIIPAIKPIIAELEENKFRFSKTLVATILKEGREK